MFQHFHGFASSDHQGHDGLSEFPSSYEQDVIHYYTTLAIRKQHIYKCVQNVEGNDIYFNKCVYYVYCFLHLSSLQFCMILVFGWLERCIFRVPMLHEHLFYPPRDR